MVSRVLGERPDIELATTARDRAIGADGGASRLRFDARHDPIGPLLDGDGYDWIVNCIGIIKPRIDESIASSVANAIAVNSEFPYQLAAEAAGRGQRVIQIATDCVYSGATGGYDESALHDPLDVYGKTKSLGEVPADNVVHLRCSIIGPELPPPSSLLGWILSAPAGADLPGYSNHLWNGVTTLHFAKLCAAVVSGADTVSLQHVVPGDTVTKAELLQLVLSAFGRDDVTVVPGPAPTAVDRTLATRLPSENAELWRKAGYDEPPTIDQMLRELAAVQRVVADQTV
jgi:dTDP-4-dehydrorhamnose reductase